MDEKLKKHSTYQDNSVILVFFIDSLLPNQRDDITVTPVILLS